MEQVRFRLVITDVIGLKRSFRGDLVVKDKIYPYFLFFFLTSSDREVV